MRSEQPRRLVGWAGENQRKTHCVHGHEFDERNTRYREDGSRQCRKCNVIQGRGYRRARAGAQ